jgi:hypothetical protein
MYDRLLKLLFESGQTEFDFDDAKEQERKKRVRDAIDRTRAASSEGRTKKKKAKKAKFIINPNRDEHQGRGSTG